MALTPSEVFEGRLRANNQFAGATRHPTYQGYDRAGSYSNVHRQQPGKFTPHRLQPYQPPTLETSFSGTSASTSSTPRRAQVERNPGIRQRQNIPHTFEHETRIDIPEVTNERAPLLPRTGGSLASGVGSAITSLATPANAAAAVTPALGIAAGVATTALVNRIKEKGAVLPGTDYVGPGNAIKIDAPRSGSDAIAKEHDIGYQEIQDKAARGDLSEQEFTEHIEQLDDDAIRKFAEHFHTSGEWQSFVGRWGLYFKRRIEAVVGPLYPSFPGKTWVVNAGQMFILSIDRIGTRLTRARDVTRWNNISLLG